MFNNPDVLVRLRGVLTAFLSIIFLASTLVVYAPDAQAATACADGIDNDGDGLIDFTNDPGCTSLTSNLENPACSDGIDNDGDGGIDYPYDGGCRSPADDLENPACLDGIDNDGDGLIDYPNDPGCTIFDPYSNLENPACADGIDNDGDGFIDYPNDPGCSALYDNFEQPACSDGIDNEGDSYIDYPADPGCTGPADNFEMPACGDGLDNDGDGKADLKDAGCGGSTTGDIENPACSDGLDNDGDLLIDYPNDPGCASPAASIENPVCSDGTDNDGDGLIDYPNDAGCANPAASIENPACSDGIDNDGDGKIDYNVDPNLGDSDCGGADDNFEETTPVTLQPGDIGIIQYRTDNDAAAIPPTYDGFSFVILTILGLAPHTQIVFTDEGWDGISLRFDDNIITSARSEHTWVWTAPASGVTAGTVVSCGGNQQFGCDAGTLEGGNSNSITNLSGSGEQILIYQGDRSNPTFLYALSTQPFITQAEVLTGASAVPPVDPITNNTTMLPPGLTNGTTAHDFDSHIDNGYYKWPSASGSRQTLLSNNLGADTNWVLANATTTPFKPSDYWNNNIIVEPSLVSLISVADSTPPPLRSTMIMATVGDLTDVAVTNGIDFQVQEGYSPVNCIRSSDCSYSVFATSSNQTVVAPAGLPVQRIGDLWNLKITPSDSGITEITVKVTKSGLGQHEHEYVFTYMALPPVFNDVNSGNGGNIARRHRKIADASAAISVGNGEMLVAGDEHVGLHDGIYLYNQTVSGEWTQNLDLSWESGIRWSPLLTDPPSELDLEGGLRDGNTAWWIGSSSNNKDGKCRPNRHGLFKVNLNFDLDDNYQSADLVSSRFDIGDQFVAWDNANTHQRGPSHYGFFHSHGASLDPFEGCWLDIDAPLPWVNLGSVWIAKRIDGFNIEGLARAPLGSAVNEALIGFRAPIVPHTLSGGTLRTRALLVPTILSANPNLTFGTPIELDLGGRGVRSIARNNQGEYLIIAGSYGEHGEPTAAEWAAAGGSGPPPNDFRLYTWSGKDPDITLHPADVPVLQAVDLTTLRHGTGSFEGIVEVPNPLTGTGSPVQLIVDDGVKIDLDISTAGLDPAQEMMINLLNREAKLMAPNTQSFRSYTVTMDTHVCFATADNGATVYGSSDAQAVQNAVHDASNGGTIKIAGRCEGESFEVNNLGRMRFGGSTVEIQDKSLTLIGGFARYDWTLSDPVARPTIIGPGVAATYTLEIGGSAILIRNIEIQGTAGNRFLLSRGTTVEQAVWNTADSGPGSLRQLIADAPAIGSVITFEPGLAGQLIILGGTQLLIDKNLTINASGLPAGLTISGDVTGNGSTTDDSRILEVGAAGNVTLRGLTLTGGRADLGGAIRNSAGVLTLEDTTVLANNATNQGGAIYNISGTVTLNRVTLSGNSAAGVAGAIFNTIGGTLSLSNSTLTGNTAYWNGGAILNEVSTLNIVHTTISNNTLGNTATGIGGGIDNAGGTVNIGNSIVAGNSGPPTGNGPDIGNRNGGAIITTGNNLIGDNGMVSTEFPAGSPNINGDIVGIPALLAPLGDYGGPTQTMPPQLGSPAIDAGAASSLTTDQRGGSRPIGSGSDIGAVEVIITSATPVSGQPGVPLTPTLTWTGFPGATFEVFLDSGAGFVSLGQTTSNSFTVGTSLASSTVYQWRVDTIIGADTFTGTDWSFTTGPLIVTTNTDENDAGLGLGSGDSLREIIAAAPAGATINFAAGLSGQSITLGGTQLTIDKNLIIDASSLPGGLTISGDVTSDGPTPDDSRIFSITNVLTVELKGFTLSGGHVTGTANGGGILSTNSSLTLTDMTLTSNSASEGGGIYFRDTSALETLTINNSVILNNTAATNGGGVRNIYGTVSINNSTLSGNTATSGAGGGIYDEVSVGSVINNSTLSGNFAVSGGGVISRGSSIAFTNSSIVSNTASVNVGGGIYLENSISASLTHTTVVNNVAGSGGSGVMTINTVGTLTIDNSIIAGNSGSPGADIWSFNSPLNVVGVNLIGDNSTVTAYFTADNLLVGTAASPVNPALVPLGNYGGPTQTMPPQLGSPAIDAAAAGSLTTDQRGLPRPDGAGPDIGAVEVQALIVTILVDENDAGLGLGTGDSLREIIAAAPPSGATINFDAGLSGQTITLGGTQLTIDKNLIIDASSLPGGLTISGDVTGDGPTPDDSRIFSITNVLTVELKGFTLSGGHVTGTANGGSIFSTNSSLTLTDTTLSGNSANEGGGIYFVDTSTQKSLTINNSAILNNTAASYGGGVRNNFGTININNSTLTGNTSTSGGGGGIFDENSVAYVVNNSTLSGNSAVFGAGVYSQDSSLITFTNSTVSGNTSTTSAGGGIYTQNTPVTLTHTTIADNSATISGGGGMVVSYTGGGNAVTFDNSIIAGNSGSPGADIWYFNGTLTATGTNLIGNNDTVSAAFPAGSPNINGDFVGVAALLAPLGDYGGPTLTMHPIDGSPAIDAATVSSLTTDQRGVLRPIGVANDIGAVEVGDVDNDGLIDSFELSIGSSPLLTDTDGDGLSDYAEVSYDGDATTYTPGADLNPLSNDTDGDGYSDGAEVLAGTDPLANMRHPSDGDLNNDGIVNVVDVLIGQQILSGQVAITPGLLTRGDVAPLVNDVPAPDGQFTVGDLVVIQQKALGVVNF